MIIIQDQFPGVAKIAGQTRGLSKTILPPGGPRLADWEHSPPLLHYRITGERLS